MDVDQLLHQKFSELAKEVGMENFKDPQSFLKSYKEIQGMSTRTAQELAQSRDMLNNQQRMFETYLAQMGQQHQAPPAPQPTEEEIAERNQKFWSELSDNPETTFNTKVEQRVNEMLAPLMQKMQQQEQERAFMERAQALERAHPDANDLMDDMVNVFTQYPNLRMDPNGLEIAYNYVRGTKYQPVDPASYLNDPSFVENHVLKNEGIRNRFLSEHMQAVKSGTPPSLMGTQSGGTQMATPPNEPKTIQESTNLLMRALGLRK